MRAAVLLLILASTAQAQVELLDLQEPGVPPRPWEQAVKHGTPIVRRTTLDGRDGVCLTSRSSSFSIQRRVDVSLDRTPELTVRWRANRLPPDADFRTRKDDQAAQFFVAFAKPLRYRAINYIWDTTAPVGAVGDYDLLWFIKVKTVVVASGGANVGRWMTFTRDVAADYRALFGDDDPPPVKAMRFQVNSQYTRSDVEGCIGSVTFHAP